MLVNIQTKLLVDAFTRAYSIIERRSSIPVLSHVLIIADQDTVTIKATDLDHSIEDKIEASVDESGAILVQAQTFYEVIRKSESDIIKLELKENDLLITANNAQFRLTTLSAEEFPETEIIDNEKSFSIEAEELKKLLDLTYFSMSNDETRYNLSGVYLHNVDNKIYAVSTDAHRLALVESSNISGLQNQTLSMILSKKTVLEYRKLLDGQKTLIEIKFNNTYISIKLDNLIFQSRLVDASFPEYTHIIPKDINNIYVTINRKAFLDAINRVSIVADEKSPLVKFKITSNKLTISSLSNNKGQAEENLSVNYIGEECNLGFNPKYLSDIASNLNSKDINMHFKDSLSAIVIKEVDNDSSTFMVMPMLVN